MREGEKLFAQDTGKPVAIVVPLYQEALSLKDEILVKHLVIFWERIRSI